jgi:hypothetical protein
MVWLAQAHREVPLETPAAWRERWAPEAVRRRVPPPPLMLDPAGLAVPETAATAAANHATAVKALEHTLAVLAERHGS